MGDILFTRAELEAWSAFSGPRWEPFKRAWFARGFRQAPVAHHEWLSVVADLRPDFLGRCVSECPLDFTVDEVLDEVRRRLW